MTREEAIKKLVNLSKVCSEEIDDNRKWMDQYLGKDLMDISTMELDALTKLMESTTKLVKTRAEINKKLNELGCFAA